MHGRELIVVLLFLAGLECGGQGATYATRSLSANTATAGMVFEAAVSLSFSDTTPSALILAETLPDGLQFLNAYWNGIPFAPSVRNGQTLKWFFGPGGEAVSAGILSYQLCVLTDSSDKVFFSGFLQIPGAGAVPVGGERLVWLNPEVCAGPAFSPVSGSIFKEELRVSLQGGTAAGAEIFICYGEPESWDDWLLYEGTFTIQHSERLQAQTWFADGSASLTSLAEYYRRGTCEIKLRRGWNLIGIPLELPAPECLKLQKMQCYFTPGGQALPPEKIGLCGQILWSFSKEDCCIFLTGLEPFERGVPSGRSSGWEAVSPVGLEEDIMAEGSETFWVWEDNRYQLARHLQPGKGYWCNQRP